MVHLRQRELRVLLDCVRDCYAIQASASFEDFLSGLVTALPRLVPAVTATYNEMDPTKPESYNIGSTPEVSSFEATIRWQQHMHEHPVLVHVKQRGDPGTVRISDFWSQRRLHNSGLYSGFYHYYRFEDSLCFIVPSNPPKVIGIGWHNDRCFTDRQRYMAELVRPHVAQALHNARLVSGMREQLRLVLQGLESSGLGAIVCDAGGHVQMITAPARSHLAEYFGMSKNLGRQLPQDLARALRHHNAQLMRSDDVPPVPRPWIVQKGDKRLLIHLLSNPGGNLLLFQQEIAKRPAAPHPLSLKHLDLSPRESEVLAWVTEGKTNSEVASILGITVGTTKKHLEHIFQKLGVETRTAAATFVRRHPLSP